MKIVKCPNNKPHIFKMNGNYFCWQPNGAFPRVLGSAYKPFHAYVDWKVQINMLVPLVEGVSF